MNAAEHRQGQRNRVNVAPRGNRPSSSGPALLRGAFALLRHQGAETIGGANRSTGIGPTSFKVGDYLGRTRSGD